MNKNVLVTGISKGVGAAICKNLLAEGYNVYGLSRTRTDTVDSFAEDYPSTFHYKSVDLQDTDQLYQTVFKTEDFLSNKIPLSGFVNNAAFAYDDIVTNLNLSQLDRMYRVNVYAPMVLTKYVIRNMIFHKIPGSIVHISSISVHTGYKGLSMYASTKGALEAFSKNVAREWGERKVRSNCIVAGFMETSMSAELSDDQKNRIYKRTALKMPTSLQSVAHTTTFLISEKSGSITGQSIFVDSGTI